MSWVLWGFFFPSQMSSHLQKKVLNQEMNRHTGGKRRWKSKAAHRQEAEVLICGGDKSSDTRKLRAICCKLRVLSGGFWFSLDKETWTNCVILGQKKIQEPMSFSPHFSISLSGIKQILTDRNSSQWTDSELWVFSSSNHFKCIQNNLQSSFYGFDALKYFSKNTQALTKAGPF